MNATCPAARPLLSFEQFLTGSRDAPLAGCDLLGVINPADELVSAEKRQRFPQRQHLRFRTHGGLKVIPGLVHNAMEKSVSHKTSTRVRPIQLPGAPKTI
jgi:hypothetical protein